MKQLIVLVCFLYPSFGKPQHSGDAVLLSYNNEQGEPDKYEFGFETSDGTKRSESGHIANEGGTLKVNGSYSYIDPDKVVHTVSYLADEIGFQPKIERSYANKTEEEPHNRLPTAPYVGKVVIASLSG